VIFSIAHRRSLSLSPPQSSDASAAPVARGWFNSLRYGADAVIAFGGFDGQERRNDVYLWSAKTN
jgi:hypothetical protein